MSDLAFNSHILIGLVFIVVFIMLASKYWKSLESFSFQFYLRVSLIIIVFFVIIDLSVGSGLSKTVVSGAYFWVALIGFCVGAVELIARYKDDPQRAIRSVPAFLYMAVNVLACTVILYILNTVRPSWLYTSTSETPVESIKGNLYIILTAGFGAVALFRSSIFKIKTTDGELSIGPAVVLDTILSASDRAVDRLMAGPRGVSVAQIMKDVSFERAKVALPSYCFALMQNVSHQEQKDIGDQVNALSSAAMDDRVRALNLGLALINLVGASVLTSAVNNLGPFIEGDPPIEQRDIARIANLTSRITYEKASLALPAYCFSLVPNVTNDAQVAFAGQVRLLSQSEFPNRVRCLILGLGLANLVTYSVFRLAVEQLGADIE